MACFLWAIDLLMVFSSVRPAGCHCKHLARSKTFRVSLVSAGKEEMAGKHRSTKQWSKESESWVNSAGLWNGWNACSAV
jgi:hypothetical protein